MNKRKSSKGGEPRPPKNAYAIYVSEQEEKQIQNMDRADKPRKYMEGWAMLEHAQQRRYLEMAAQDKIRFSREMRAYNKAQGNSSPDEEDEPKPKKLSGVSGKFGLKASQQNVDEGFWKKLKMQVKL
ncbi:hypothetical protein AAG570_011788 [Ranatra chinensis]|uniref:HMG box domain-containing protein n=1 Tax=Ranatra chinensis TaxID=642074 RepID=A0ABD0YTD5_9HEMI